MAYTTYDDENSILQYLNSLQASANDSSYYKGSFHDGVGVTPFQGGRWYVEGFRATGGHGWQKLIKYEKDKIKELYRSCVNGIWGTFIQNVTSSDLNVLVERVTGTVITGNASILDMSICQYGHMAMLLIQVEATQAINSGGNITITFDKSLNNRLGFAVVGYSGGSAVIGSAASNTVNFRVINQLDTGATVGASGCFIF